MILLLRAGSRYAAHLVAAGLLIGLAGCGTATPLRSRRTPEEAWTWLRSAAVERRYDEEWAAFGPELRADLSRRLGRPMDLEAYREQRGTRYTNAWDPIQGLIQGTVEQVMHVGPDDAVLVFRWGERTWETRWRLLPQWEVTAGSPPETRRGPVSKTSDVVTIHPRTGEITVRLPPAAWPHPGSTAVPLERVEVGDYWYLESICERVPGDRSGRGRGPRWVRGSGAFVR